MSDDLDIRSGGAVAVDTDSLRDVAGGLEAVGAALDDVQTRLLDERRRLIAADPSFEAIGARIDVVARDVAHVVHAASMLAARLERAAALYEIVELRAEQHAAEAAGDHHGADRAEARLAVLRRDDPELYGVAMLIEQAWWYATPTALAAEASGSVVPGWPFGASASPFGAFGMSATAALALGAGAWGRGRIPRNAVLAGPAAIVDVQQARAPSGGTAPTSLASAIDRMPQTGAQVRVERYSMPDGTRRFAVYVAGTRALINSGEPWDFESNVQLYTGQRSASYDATMLALQRAGAQPGDAVYSFGHSQGGMIASHIALEGEYDMRALVTFGSPVAGDVGPDTLSVQLRHTDDPIAALAAGGSPAGVGTDDSFIAERLADPAPGLDLAAHDLDEYRETAAMIDASADPRALALGDVFTELADAESMAAFEYTARRAIVLAPAQEPTGFPAV